VLKWLDVLQAVRGQTITGVCAMGWRHRRLYRKQENQNLFAIGMTDLVGTNILYHSIDTGDADPVRRRAYRQSPEMMKEMKRQVRHRND